MIQRDWMLWFGAGGGSCGGMMGACLGRKGKNATSDWDKYDHNNFKIIGHHNFNIIGHHNFKIIRRSGGKRGRGERGREKLVREEFGEEAVNFEIELGLSEIGMRLR